MAHLTLAGVSDDGKRLLLVSDAGVEYTVDIDPRLRAALRGDPERRLEIRMDSALRPRDIQARIRAGETAEALAEEAQTTVEKIMTFAAPVLAERQHVAERAQRSSVRRKGLDNGSAGGARTLGDVVAFHLRSLNIDPDSVTWDAWRREDGRWTLTGEYSATKRTGAAHFTFDAPGNFVTADNDDARWLLGENAPGSRAADSAPAGDDLGRARERRLASVPEEELPLGDDAIELVTETADDAVGSQADDGLGTEMPLEAFLTDEPTADESEVREEAAEAAALDTEGDEEEPPARRPTRKSRGRASVPSWDEIMFGGGKND